MSRTTSGLGAKSYSKIEGTTCTTFVKLTLSNDVKGVNLITADTVLRVTIFWVSGIQNNQIDIYFPKGDSIYNYVLFQTYYLSCFVPEVGAVACSGEYFVLRQINILKKLTQLSLVFYNNKSIAVLSL